MDTKELPYWSLKDSEVLKKFKTEPLSGLTEQQVLKSREQYGFNILKQVSPVSLWRILVEQIKSIIVLLLFIAIVLSFLFQQWVEGIAVGAVLVINTAIGFFTELKAVRSMESLRSLGQMKTRVIRGGKADEISAEEIVPGDIVCLEGGDVVTADIRVIEASRLYVDESALTGESVPVEKDIKVLNKETELAGRSNMLFKGTSITNGSAKGIVVRIGMDTELGQISSLTETAEQESTPLEKSLNALGAKLVWLTLVIAVTVTILGILSGKELILMVQTGIALAVAAIPEGLPIVATIALARGMWLMAKENALINKLSSVETLGAVTVICTDKTGTLTENKMTARVYELDNEKIDFTSEESKGLTSTSFLRALEVGALCNNAVLSSEIDSGFLGDPTEVALLEAAEKKGFSKESLLVKYPKIKEDAFDPDLKMMATYHKEKDKVLVAVKGAPESILEVCTKKLTLNGESNFTSEDKKEWLEKSNLSSQSGLRILALSYKNVDDEVVPTYENLVFVGLVGLLDPPRETVKEAISHCKQAGIKVVMVTGDQAGTACKISKEVGLTDGEVEPIHGREIQNLFFKKEESKKMVFYRVNPKQKLELVNCFQKNNEVVAMTGDGVNDAPALKKADIGVAMGIRGTQVAKDVSDMILLDDNFKTIVSAIKQGRVIFVNIRRFVTYLLSCNLSEVLIVFLATIANAPLPILPLQILYLNLITDVFPALALGMGEGDESYLNSPPRKSNESIVQQSQWLYIIISSLLMTISVLIAFFIALNSLNIGQQKSVTVAFLTLGLAQVFHVFNMTIINNSRVVANDIVKNPNIWGAVVLCIFLLLVPLYVPGLSQVFGLWKLGLNEWKIIILFSLLPLLIGQILVYLKKQAISLSQVVKNH